MLKCILQMHQIHSFAHFSLLHFDHFNRIGRAIVIARTRVYYIERIASSNRIGNNEFLAMLQCGNNSMGDCVKMTRKILCTGIGTNNHSTKSRRFHCTVIEWLERTSDWASEKDNFSSCKISRPSTFPSPSLIFCRFQMDCLSRPSLSL